jgi:hypothetical protein
MNNGTRLDLKFTKQPVLLLASELKDNELKSKIKSFYSHQVVGLADLLNYYNAKAIIVRPDRFILETCPPGFNLNEFIKNKLNELNIV